MARRGEGALHAARGRLDPAEVGGRAGRRCAADATRPGRSDRWGREPDRDAGLTVTIRLPAAPTGQALSVLSYGATPGRNSDDASAAFRRAINAARSGDEILVPKAATCSSGPTWCSRAASGALLERGGDHHQVHHQLRRFVTIADNLIKNALATGPAARATGS